MFFAARETVERWAADKDAKAEARGREKGRQEGLLEGAQVGREAERQRIAKLLEESGVSLPPEVTDSLNADKAGQP
jgi:predicted transposase YdaD